jgi:hypothetical protein
MIPGGLRGRSNCLVEYFGLHVNYLFPLDLSFDR